MNRHVIIYSLPTCAFCQEAKAYFKRRHIPFTEVSVDKDPKSQKEMIFKSGQFSVPVVDVDGQIIVGFQKKMLDVLLPAD